MTCYVPGLKRPHSSLFSPRYSVRAMRVLREKRQRRSSDWLFISWYSETQDKDLGSCQGLFPHPPRGAGVYSPYNGLYGKASPERGSFFSPQVHGGRDFISSVCERPKWLTHAFNGCEKDKLTWFSDLFIFTKKRCIYSSLKGYRVVN